MPSTHLALNLHLVFSTKDREPWIDTSWRSRLHEYLGGALRNMNAASMIVGGVADHVHLLVGLRATHQLAAVMRELKSESSRWVHQNMSIERFAWQEGYGAFSVSPSHVERVRNYVLSQEEHHRVKTFQEEYRELLEKCSIPFKEEHLW